MIWQLQDAKNRLSEIVGKASSEGPQTVTLRGKRAAVIVSADDYDRLIAAKPTLADHLLTGPAWDDDVVAEVNARNPSRSRRLNL